MAFIIKETITAFVMLLLISYAKSETLRYCSDNNTLSMTNLEYMNGKEIRNEIKYYCEYGCFNSTILIPYPYCYAKMDTAMATFYSITLLISFFLMFLTNNRICWIVGSLILILLIAINLGMLLEYPTALFLLAILIALSIYRIFTALA